jgi:hypothetical protein
LISDPQDILFKNPTFEFGFDIVNGASGYRFYARNDGLQTDWLQVAEVGQGEINILEPRATISVPSVFDSFPGADTPFANGESLEFTMVALIGGNEGPFAAPTVNVADVGCPQVEVSVDFSTGSWNNRQGDEAALVQVQIRGAGGEHLATSSVAAISFAPHFFQDAAGDPFTLDGNQMVQTQPDLDHIVLTGQIPAGADARLDVMTVDLSAVADPSGNPSCDATHKELIGAGEAQIWMWDFEQDNGGFTVDSLWEYGTAGASGPLTAYSGESMWGTDLDAVYPPTADTPLIYTLASPQVRLPDVITALAVPAWIEIAAIDLFEVLWIPTTGSPAILGSSNINSPAWSEIPLTYPLAGTVGHLEFRFTVASLAGTLNGVFLDDIVIGGIWSLPPS